MGERAEGLSQGAQQSVAGEVPQAVVHCLEVVDVQEENRHLVLLASGACQCVADLATEQRPIGKTCQRVMKGLEDQVLRPPTDPDGESGLKEYDYRKGRDGQYPLRHKLRRAVHRQGGRVEHAHKRQVPDRGHRTEKGCSVKHDPEVEVCGTHR